MAKKGGRAARARFSSALGANDPRIRRNAQAQATKDDTGAGLSFDDHGRQQTKLGGPLFVNPQGEIDVRVAEGLEVTPGSPRAVRVKPGRGIEIVNNSVAAVVPIPELELDSFARLLTFMGS